MESSSLVTPSSIFQTAGKTIMCPGNAWSVLAKELDRRRADSGVDTAVILVDDFFPISKIQSLVSGAESDVWINISTEQEPRTDQIDALMAKLRANFDGRPCAVVGIGGGITMDTAKAVSNLYTNDGFAANFQGWDLLEYPGVHKIAVPTISGTGAEASRTCVMTNATSGLKLGMNSNFTFFDEVLLDSTLMYSVPDDQYFFTAMDTYMHGFESLAGRHRNGISDSLAVESLRLIREIFTSDEAKSPENREKLMIASYLGGTAIAGTYVGLVHPFSAGLSVVFGIHHGVANCMVMRGMEEFYPSEYLEFWNFAEKQDVVVPRLDRQLLDTETLTRLTAATLIHERPLTNALGSDYRLVLSPRKVEEIFRQM